MLGSLTSRLTVAFLAALGMLLFACVAAGAYLYRLALGAMAAPATVDLARQAWLTLAGLAGISLALGFFMAQALAARLAGPAADLEKALRERAAGKPVRPLMARTGWREIDSLTAAFNALAASLDERENNAAAACAKMADLQRNYIDLIGFLSHELKGILATSVMNVCAVRDRYFGDLNERQLQALDGAARSLDYLTVTVRKFLNLVKIEKGELKLSRRPGRLREDIFDKAVNIMAPLALRKNMAINNRIGAEIKIVLDPELIHVVVCNLISNAIKYGHAGGEITLACAARDGWISVEIYNDSTPLTAPQQAQLFKRFSRPDTPATRSAKGTGLGLFISREIVQLHGGKIRTEARERGNAFIFEIPQEAMEIAYASKT